MVDSDEEEVINNGPVHVHRLKQGKSVTIGPAGWSLSQQPPATSSSRAVETQPKYPLGQLTENGNSLSTYYWSQDPQQVVVSVPVPGGTKAKSVIVEFNEKHLKICLDGQQLLGGETALPIDTEHDYTDWELVDWEPGMQGRRLLRLTLKKKVPHDLQVVLWWPKLLVTESASVDPASISGRREGAENFKQAWEAAHEQFREKVHAMPTTEVAEE